MRFLADYLREPRTTAIRPNRPTPNRLRLVGSGAIAACAALVAVIKAMPLKSKHTILFMIIPPITSDDNRHASPMPSRILPVFQTHNISYRFVIVRKSDGAPLSGTTIKGSVRHDSLGWRGRRFLTAGRTPPGCLPNYASQAPTPGQPQLRS